MQIKWYLLIQYETYFPWKNNCVNGKWFFITNFKINMTFDVFSIQQGFSLILKIFL